MEFHTYLENKGVFTPEACDSITSSFKSKAVKKGEFILQADKYFDKLLFIESGLVKAFHVKDGKDITHFFFPEDHFIAPVNTLFYNSPERYQLIALEDCQLQTIRFQNFLALGEQFPKLMNIALEFAIKMCDFLSRKLDIVKFERAFDKYKMFLEMYPNLKNRVSLGDTASFLGNYTANP